MNVHKLRIVIVGGSHVGKTTLVGSILDGSILETNIDDNSARENDKDEVMIVQKRNSGGLNNSSSIFSGIAQKDIEYKNKIYRVSLIDSESQTKATTLSDNKYFSEIHGYLLVFAHDDPQSFETIQHTNLNIIQKVGNKYVPRVLVGNKSDLESDITSDRIKRLSKKILCPYVECSVREGKNLDKILMKIIKEINKEINEEHPYDIRNLNRELNFISREARSFRQILNILLISLITISIMLAMLDIVAFAKHLDASLISIPAFCTSIFSAYINFKTLRLARKKESETILGFTKNHYFNIVLILVVVVSFVMNSSGIPLDYLTLTLYIICALIQVR